MQDMKAQLEKLQNEAAECAIIAGLTTDKRKRDLFARMSAHYLNLAHEVQCAIEEAEKTK